MTITPGKLRDLTTVNRTLNSHDRSFFHVSSHYFFQIQSFNLTLPKFVGMLFEENDQLKNQQGMNFF